MPVALLANVGDPAGVAAAVEVGAEGVGLFRTEFCFLDRAEAPSVSEQAAAYREVLGSFPGRKVVVRTLDAGADKPLPFLTEAGEPNPALGVRGLRTAVRAPQVLDDQLAAIAAAAADCAAQVWVMAPMVATAAEAAGFVERCAGHGLDMAGVMVEVPAAALCADAVLEHAAFASLGTNDLAQYALAADRLLGSLAALNDPWQPALLRLVAMTAQAGARRNRPVGVCGEAAADPALACVLVGLGVTSLSMAPRSIPLVAAALGGATSQACTAAATSALAAADPAGARAATRTVLTHLADLGY
jgi:phosphotransferase system enzyme I (PtsI)